MDRQRGADATIRGVGDGKSVADVETISAAGGAVSRSGVRTIAIGEVTDTSPESLAGTMAIGTVALAPSELASNLSLERYVPIRELGRGGMGRVDVIYDRALGRHVARKTVLEGRSTALLVAEAQICAQLEHPSIVPLYDVGMDARGDAHYTMRVINGRSLRDVLEDNDTGGKPHVGLTKLLGILRQVCLAVDYAHSRGVIHRDLKPENIVVGSFGEVYVLDWGVAHVCEGSDIAQSGGSAASVPIAGSPGYMAPEQAIGGPMDARTDVFALGVILHEILTGRRPFEDADIPSLLQRTLKHSFPPPSRAVPERNPPVAFDALVRACLLREPEERPSSARHVADAIDIYLDGERVLAERTREAGRYAQAGDEALRQAEDLDTHAAALEGIAQAELTQLSPWESLETKRRLWDQLDEVRRQRAEGGRALARAEIEYGRALGRVSDHAGARAGLARLHYRQFVAAEAASQADAMAQHLHLARMYDDGDLALELRDEGELTILAPHGVVLELARFEQEGLLLQESDRMRAKTVDATWLLSGSYVVHVIDHAAGEFRFPLVIQRARRHMLRLRVPVDGEVPHGFTLIPGGPFLAWPPRAERPQAVQLRDYAIGTFPVTFRQYAEFLETLPETERARRMPSHNRAGAALERTDEKWSLVEGYISGAAGRSRIGDDRELDVPVAGVSWFHAMAYIRWRSQRDGRQYRLPTDMEWEKAMRGADGRKYPMGNQLDPSFAKLRESRPEASQPEPIGSFELDASPYGVRDLAGGVWDWTATSSDGAPLPSLADEGKPEAEQRQAYFRGGNWGMLATSPMVRAPMRLDAFGPGVGFRLAISLDQNGSSSLEVEPMRR